jgi:hypothetical protein
MLRGPAAPSGILQSLVKTRFGFQIVGCKSRLQSACVRGLKKGRCANTSAIDTRILGNKVPFELNVLAGRAEVHGVNLERSASPRVQ